MSGRTCNSAEVCGDGRSCSSGVCRWADAPIDVRRALGPELQGRALMRVRATLGSSDERAAAPNVHSSGLDYTARPRSETQTGANDSEFVRTELPASAVHDPGIASDSGLASRLHTAERGGSIVKVQRLTLDGDIDFEVLTRTLARLFAGRPPVGRQGGLDRVTRAVELLIACPRTTAVQLVGALLFRDQLALSYDASGEEIWTFREPPARC